MTLRYAGLLAPAVLVLSQMSWAAPTAPPAAGWDADVLAVSGALRQNASPKTLPGQQTKRLSAAAGLDPKTLAQVCDRIPTNDGTARCFQAAGGRATNGYALAACDRFRTQEGTIDCVRAIAGRSYDPDEVLACDRISGEQNTVACLASAGRWDDGRGDDGHDRLGAELRRIIGYCRDRYASDRDVLRCVEDHARR